MKQIEMNASKRLHVHVYR